MNIITELLSHFRSNAPLVPADNIKAVELFADKIQYEYNALCPESSEFPDGYEWFSINADGLTLFWVTKPEISCDCWINVTSKVFNQKDVILPLGLDWRLCLWSIEDAKRIWEGGKSITTNQPDWDWDITYWAYSSEYVYDKHNNKRLISDLQAELEERTERRNSEMLKDE